jgi:hypothetical protein
MNHQSRLLEIIEFLRPYQTIWQNEIMLLYPTPLEGYPEAWVDDLLRFQGREEMIRLERKQVQGLIKDPSLKGLYDRREKLIEVPQARKLPPMPEDSFTFLYMIPKKQHEIRRLAPMVDAFYQGHGIKRVVDIGGGIGLMAQTLVNQYGHQVCSVDMDSIMQTTGRTRHEKNAKDPSNLVDYKTVKVERGNSAFAAILEQDHMTLGLHTCGALAVAQLEASAGKQIKAIIGLGCCYHKMENTPEALNISKFVKDHGAFELSKFALTLASRAHLKLPEKDFDFKLKVKHYRYAIHFLLHDEYGMKELVPLGNSKRELYNESFGTYALEQLGRLNIKINHTKEELTTYYLNEKRQALIKKMLAAGIIRDTFGRLLELYILLDRAVYLEEKGYKVELLQCFDEVLSPRNLGLFCHRNCHLTKKSLETRYTDRS